MQHYDGLKTHYCVMSVLTLFIVCAASRTVNKNVSIGAEQLNQVHRREFVNYWRTIKPVSVTSLSLRKNRIA